jgi:CRISPR/Cas system-associated exonuclease Cas4 (RecB family)
MRASLHTQQIMNEDTIHQGTAKDAIRTAAKGFISLLCWLGHFLAWQKSIRSIASGELASRHLVFAEKEFSIQRPLPVRVRVDRVYDTGRGLVLLELKTRSRRKIYQDDIIELSAQRLAVGLSTGRDVYRHGYVLLIHPLLRSRSLHRVDLLTATEVVELADRRKRLLTERAVPAKPRSTTLCSKCEYRAECAALAARDYVPD